MSYDIKTQQTRQFEAHQYVIHTEVSCAKAVDLPIRPKRLLGRVNKGRFDVPWPAGFPSDHTTFQLGKRKHVLANFVARAALEIRHRSL